MRTTILTAATLGVAALALGQLAPASTATTSAEPATTDRASSAVGSIGVKDPADLDHGVDLRSVQVAHRTKNVVVTTTHTNLRPSWRTGSSGAVFIDTDPGNRGPEYVFAGGYFSGTDYQLLHTDGFATKTWGTPVEGSYVMRVDYDRDQVRMKMSRKALGSPEQVRVAVRVAGTRTDGTNTQKDWLGEPRSWTEPVAR